MTKKEKKVENETDQLIVCQDAKSVLKRSNETKWWQTNMLNMPILQSSVITK